MTVTAPSGSVVRAMRPVEDGPVAAQVAPAQAKGSDVGVRWDRETNDITIGEQARNVSAREGR